MRCNEFHRYFLQTSSAARKGDVLVDDGSGRVQFYGLGGQHRFAIAHAHLHFAATGVMDGQPCAYLRIRCRQPRHRQRP